MTVAELEEKILQVEAEIRIAGPGRIQKIGVLRDLRHQLFFEKELERAERAARKHSSEPAASL